MRKLYFFILMLSGIAQAQIVNIPDAAFKAALITQGVDADGDGDIQLSEALATQNLDLNNTTISDLTGLEAFQNLIIFTCHDNNQLTAVDVSGFASLISLHCYNNIHLNSVNFTNCPLLDVINCNNNALTSLDLTGLTTVNQLHAFYNDISSVHFTNPVRIGELMLQYNQLENLDLSKAIWTSALVTIEISGNPLQTLNLKNGMNEQMDNLLFVASSGTGTTLQYICQDENQVAVLKNHLQANYGNTTCEVNSYCTTMPGGNYNTITGTVTYDVDNNGCDLADAYHPYVKVTLSDGLGNGSTFTNANGDYAFYTTTGTFNWLPDFEHPTWFTVTPSGGAVTFPNNNNNIQTQNFCVAANGTHSDVEMVIEPIVPARPGFDAVYRLVYKNNGNQTETVFVNFGFDQTRLQVVTMSATPYLSLPGDLAWQVANVLPFESGSIEVTLHVNGPTDTPAVNIDDVLSFTSFVDITTDENWSDNAFDMNQVVTGAYDPNDITCIEGRIVAPTEIGDYLHYVIRFENTGNAAAENIVVKVEVNPNDFNINSLRLLNASHAVMPRIRGNTVEFVFPHIQLESGGHGNVLLKIQSLSSLQQGDVVNKRANIYFDYNYPVQTNDAETTFQLLSNPEFEVDHSVSIYPNPSHGIVNIKGDFRIQSMQLFDVQGRLLQTDLVNDTRATMDVSAHSGGIYFVKVVTDKGIRVEKLVK